MLNKLWSSDRRFTAKSCASVIIIGSLVSLAILIIRVVGEHRLQRFLNWLPIFRRRPEVEKLIDDAFLSDNRS